MTFGLRYASRTDRGLVREGNEDSVYAGDRVLAVADGMGGHAAGEVASSEVINEVAGLDRAEYASNAIEALTEATLAANGRLRERVAEDSSLEGMGTTLAALLLSGDTLAMLHVGDSRVYVYEDGQLQQLTRDDTYVQQLVDEGRITETEATTHPQRSLLTQALDGREVEPHTVTLHPRPGQRYLVCSDGLSGFVPEDVIAAALERELPAEAVDVLIDEALRRGAPDNVTVVVADILLDEDSEEAEPSGSGRTPYTTPSGAVTSTAIANTADLEAPPELRSEPEVAHVGDAPPAAVAVPGDGDEEEEPSKRRMPRWLSFLVAIVVILAASLVLVALWAQGQWYVGESDGQVAIYQGVPETVGSVDLSRVEKVTNIAVDDLNASARSRVEDTIPADSLEEAEAEVENLRKDLLPECPPPEADTDGSAQPGVNCREVSS